MFPFCGYQPVGKLFFFFYLPGKVYADVINVLQYCLAKKQTKSEMYAKYIMVQLTVHVSVSGLQV